MDENGRFGGHFYMRSFFPLLLLAACGPARPGIQHEAGVDAPSTLLRVHNRERAAAGVEPLSWDPRLAASAAGHANQLASNGQLRHSPRTARPGQGENLWIGTRGAYRVEQMVGSWVTEKSIFRPGVFPAVSASENWSAVGHYTQMIWPTTTRLGCSIARSRRVDVLVCRYAPAGNIDGRRVP